MTRDQIKLKIDTILSETQRIKFNSGHPIITYTDEAIEEIMKLWDKGFVCEIKDQEE